MANLILAKTKPFDLANIFSTFITQWYYYVLLLAVIVAIVIFSVCKKSNRNTLSKTQNLVYTAVFTALAFVVNAFVSISISPWNTLSFTATIGFVAGYLLGGARGFAVAFIGDFLGAIIMPFGPYSPFIALATSLMGFVPGMIFEMKKGNKYLKVAISFLIVFVLGSLILNNVGCALMYGYTVKQVFLLSILGKSLTMIVNCAICMVVVTVLPKVLPKDKFNL